MSNIAALARGVALIALLAGGWAFLATVLQSQDPTRAPTESASTVPSTMTPEADIERPSLVGESSTPAPQPPATSDSRAERVAGQIPDLFAGRLARAFGVNAERTRALTPALLEAAEAEGVDAMILSAVVMTESSFRTEARSSAGAIGPAQVVPKWWAHGLCGELDLTRARDNLHCGARVLSHYTDRCDGQVMCALRYYNVGPGAMSSGDPAAWFAGLRYQQKVADYWGDILGVKTERLARVD